MKSRYFLSGLILIILFACSKDDNPSPPDEANGTMKGVFIDSPVEGLKYETETHSGFTDENGNYDYEEGETVTFYVGDITLGSAVATGELSPIDIANTPNADIETIEVQNIAAFLQTLDEDADPSNGIKISPEIAASISLSEIDFSAPIIQILGEIVIEVFQETGKNLTVVFPEIAAVHLASTLNIEYEPEVNFTSNFLRAFTNYFSVDIHSSYAKGATIALFWLHEFDEEGILVKATAYEKYPFRILSEYYFSNYDSIGLTVDLQIRTMNYYDWKTYDQENYSMKFDSNFFIKEIVPGEGAVIDNRVLIEEHNSENLIVTKVILDNEGLPVQKVKYAYDLNGNVLETRVIPTNGTERISQVFTYTSFGEVKTIKNYVNENYTKEYNYFYRDDKSLEEINYSFTDGTSTYLFSDSEYLKEWESIYDNGYKVIYTYNPNEKVENEFYDGVLVYNYYYRFEDGYGYSGFPYKWEWHENGILRERYTLNENYGNESYEYFYDNGNLEYKDFYDEEGNWIYTEYYDEEGNLVNTEYHE